MTVAHPLQRAWVSTGGTGAQNYDEFADEAEITAIVATNPASALAIEMPHRAPDSLGSFTDALPAAAARLAAAKEAGRYAPAADVAVLYRIDRDFLGLFCLVDTAEISTSADEPGQVIRNEDVFIDKVRERVALAEATGHLLSPVLLLQTGRAAELHAGLAATVADLGPAAVRDVDQAGRTHEIWVLGPGPQRDLLLDLAGGGELIVADGNHRSLAAQIGGAPRFLAVITTPDAVRLRPYNRLVAELPMGMEGLVDALRAAGATVEPLAEVAVPATSGVVHLYAEGRAVAARLPVPDGSVVERLDHAVVERVLLHDVLGLEPGDKRITYVGGDYPAGWLRDEVDAGRAALAILIAPVGVDAFVDVNLARLKMPRKSTWFVPKARAGLVLTELPT